MPTFPLSKRPTQSYRHGGLSFLYKRFSKTDPTKLLRVHAACDLVGVDGQEVYACEDGVIMSHDPFVRIPNDPAKPYRYHVYCCDIKLDSGPIVRYGEIHEKLANGLKVGSRVKEGQHIGWLRIQENDSMLHFEMYDGSLGKQRFRVDNDPRLIFRRADLIDPTPYLDSCKVAGEAELRQNPRLYVAMELRQGSYGMPVSMLQTLLNIHNATLPKREKDEANLTTDGDFGNKTRLAVIAFQKRKGIKATGTSTRPTWEALLKFLPVGL